MFDRWSNNHKLVAGGVGAVAALAIGSQVASQPRTIQGWAVGGQSMQVDVKGAVVHPGLYKFSTGSRINDALKAAGGPTEDAATDSLNLAAALEDGMEVRVPRIGEQVTAPPVKHAGPAKPGAKGSSGKKQLPTGKIPINTATLQELQQLPGVGPATAQRIIDYRNQVHGFRSVAEIEQVKGIGPKKFAQMRPYLSL
ncbi:MAG: helix-hairpin-helix domain-containing protein [Fimbriimonadaceae bacterium]|nr:helix-hairpin-helix domain-containing protein [Fimbriimonadaceae bacterium]